MQLTRLTLLRLDGNRLSELVPEIGNLRELTTLGLRRNPFEENLEAKELRERFAKLRFLDVDEPE